MIESVHVSYFLVEGLSGWEKVLCFNDDHILPRDEIKSSQFGTIVRGYALHQHGMVMQIKQEVCLKFSSLALNAVGKQAASNNLVFENAVTELEVMLALAMHQHPHIMPLLMAGVMNKQLVLVMPLARCNLSEAMVKPDLLPRVREQIGSALQYMHSMGFAHRDVSLENIVEMHDGSLKLIDFGLAKKLQRAESGVWCPESLDINNGTRYIVGKLRYLAPEFFVRSVTETFDLCACDAFSLGVCLLFLAVRKFPYQCRSTNEPENRMEWSHMYTTLPSDALVSVCERIGKPWISTLLWLSPDLRGTVGQFMQQQ
jgi:serine/threonine protein kinase